MIVLRANSMACSIDVLTNHGASGAKAKNGKLPGGNCATSCADIAGMAGSVLPVYPHTCGMMGFGGAGTASWCVWAWSCYTLVCHP